MFELDENEGAFSSEFERLDFEKQTILAGSGLLIPSLLLGLIPILISICLTCPSKRFKSVARIKHWIDDTFLWNYSLRLIFLASLDIAIMSI